MCILLKLDYAKFGVSNLFFQKLSKENLCPPPPPLVKEGLKIYELNVQKILMYTIFFSYFAVKIDLIIENFLGEEFNRVN